MNILLISNIQRKDFYKYTYLIKDSLSLDNFNLDLYLTYKDDYADITCDSINSFYSFDNNNLTFKDSISLYQALKINKKHLIIIDLSINNYQTLLSYLKKHTKAQYVLLQSMNENEYVKYKYKMIAQKTLSDINKLEKEKYYYSQSLLLLNNLYHIRLENAYNPFDVNDFKEIIDNVNYASKNPYNSRLYNNRFYFKLNSDFIDDLYYFNRFSYMVDLSNEKVDYESIKNDYDMFIIDKKYYFEANNKNVIFVDNNMINSLEDLLNLINKKI